MPGNNITAFQRCGVAGGYRTLVPDVNIGADTGLQLIREQIVVSAIAPGAFPSDMNRAARDEVEATSRRIPAGRVGQPEDLAAAAIYLASRAGDYVVGETLVVDGGVTHAR